MLGFYTFKYSLYAIIYIGIGVTAVLHQKLLETIFLFLAFVFLRYCFPKTYHCDNVYHCVFWSIAIFFIAVPYTPNVSISIFGSVLIGCTMSMVLYYVQDYYEIKSTQAKTIDILSKDELVQLLNNSLLTEEEKSAIRYYVIEKVKGETFYKKMGYSKRQTLRIYKSAITKINKIIQHK